ncbi:DMT family transporter [Breoghania sp. L-A4]|uniref:DMT family transporter n=1 Tax=Breoghania sp. L-A4 TaxID=2304600 RepID=UPI000E35A1FA|nr:DMT family transporter [Breoghania sp. L-A4]AXS42756.1 DMT family transporter [Breoghania sp. L-A4]
MADSRRGSGRVAINVDDTGSFTAEETRARLSGIVLIVGAVACFACLDTIAKYVSQSVPPLEVVWFRFATHLVLACVVFRVWKRRDLIATKRPVLQILRALSLLGSTFFNFLALQHLQLAETMSIMFAGPLLVTALAGPVLGEWAGPRRWAAICVGFLGVLVVTQPGTGGLHWAVMYSLAAMVSYAFYALTTRILTGTDSVQGMLIISAAVAVMVMTPPAVAVWTMPPDALSWVLLLCTGIFGGVGHWLLIRAHAIVPAPVLAPFFYSQIVWMVGLGWLVFADLPGPSTVIGASIVTASGLYLLYRERRLKKPKPPLPEA